MIPIRASMLFAAALFAAGVSPLAAGLLLASALKAPALTVKTERVAAPVEQEQSGGLWQPRPPLPPQQETEVDASQQAEPLPLPPSRPKCIADTSGFRGNTYTIELANTCELTLRCTVRAYVVNSHGPTRAVARFTLAPRSAGAAARKAHVIRLKEFGGSADTSRQCRVI